MACILADLNDGEFFTFVYDPKTAYEKLYDICDQQGGVVKTLVKRTSVFNGVDWVCVEGDEESANEYASVLVLPQNFAA